MSDNPDEQPDNPFKGTPFEQFFGGQMPDLAGLMSQVQAMMAAPESDTAVNVVLATDIARKTVAAEGDALASAADGRAAAEAVQVAAAEKQLAEDMARDRRRAEAAAKPAAAGSLGPTRPAAPATVKTATAGKGKDKGKKKGDGGEGEDFVAVVPGKKS